LASDLLNRYTTGLTRQLRLNLCDNKEI